MTCLIFFLEKGIGTLYTPQSQGVAYNMSIAEMKTLNMQSSHACSARGGPENKPCESKASDTKGRIVSRCPQPFE